MNTKEAAAALNGNEYRNEGAPGLFAQMKADGLVAVFGASDDLIEFRGAVHDEDGAYGGGEFLFTRSGRLVNRCDEGDDCPYFSDIAKTATVVEAKWADASGLAWSYDTAIPHEKFVILEDGDPYCEGIVFALADVPS